MAPHARVWRVGRAELRAYRVRKQLIEFIERELDRREFERRVQHDEHGDGCQRQRLVVHRHYARVRATDSFDSADRP